MLKKGEEMNRMLTVRALLIVLLLVGASASAALAEHPYPHNGVFIEHGYVCVAKTDEQIQEVVLWCQDRGIEYEFLNITGFEDDGTMDPANYSELGHYISVARATDPNQKLIAYCSGSLRDHVNEPATHQNIADECKMFFDVFGVDGVNLDFEPFQADNQNYLDLYSLIRQTVGAGAHLSLDTTANPTWSGAFLNEVSTYFDLLCPMFYDTGYREVASYQDWVVAGMHHHSDNIAANCEAYPLIPTHKRSRWHIPDVENICTATDALMQSVPEGCAMHSLGVWWRYDWGSDDEQMWWDCWMNRFEQPPVADFSGNPTSGPAPLTVYFTDLSMNDPTSWHWTFGDGGESYSQHPVYEYQNEGSYTVTLTAANAHGDDTETKTEYITVTSSGGTCHVGSIELVGLYKSTGPPSGRGYYAEATITIHDQDCQPLSDVTVDITWSGCVSGSDSGVTNGSGQVVLSSPTDPDGGSFTCCVDNLTKYAYPYQSGDNHETCDSVTNP
jgi:PKD repeat protein